MKKVLELLFSIPKYHKKKILAFLVFTVVMFVLIFPTDDITDFMTTKIAQETGEQVYVQANGMGFSLFPTLGIKFVSVVIQMFNLPKISADSLSISPSIISLLHFSPGAHVEAEGLFGASVRANLEDGDKTKAGEHYKKVDFSAENLELGALSQFLREMGYGDFSLRGGMNIKLNAKADPKFDEQPVGDFDIDMANFLFPSYAIPVFGNIPELKFKKSSIKGNFSDGALHLDDLTLGDDKDDLVVKVKGEITARFRAGGGPPDFGSYNFQLEVTASQGFYTQNSTMFGLLDTYRKPGGGNKFALKLSAPSLTVPPQMSRL